MFELIFDDTLKAFRRLKSSHTRTVKTTAIRADTPTPAEGFGVSLMYEFSPTHIDLWVFEYDGDMASLIKTMLNKMKCYIHGNLKRYSVKTNKWEGIWASPEHKDFEVTAFYNGASETWYVPLEWVAECDSEAREGIAKYILIALRRFLETIKEENNND